MAKRIDRSGEATVVDVLAGGDLVTPASYGQQTALDTDMDFDTTDTDIGWDDIPDDQDDDTPDDVPAVAAPRLVPERELSPEQRRIRDLEHQLALERGRKDPDPELEPPVINGSTANILIHFVDDGLTALGKVWCRGQELEFTPGSRAYNDTKDRTGRSWLELRDDEAGQLQRYGRVMFRSGPWTGKGYDDIATAAFEPLKPLTKDGAPPARPTSAELAAAMKAEATRRRSAPVLPAR